MRRAIVAVVVGLMTWVVQDVAIWGRFFDGRPWSPAADQYQYWHQAFLFLLIVVGMAWVSRWWGIWFAVALWVLANSGPADVLYYWVGGEVIPQNLPWLDTLHPFVLFHPATASSVVLSSAIWTALFALSLTLPRTIAAGSRTLLRGIHPTP